MSDLIKERIIKLFKELDDAGKDEVLADLNVIIYEDDEDYFDEYDINR